MKKIIFIMLGVTVFCLLLFFIYGQNQHVVIENTKTKKNIINTNALTMMYETDYQSGEYQISSESTWPQDGYVFNETLSSCENGSTLTWDDENKRVVMQANTSDKCYVYFEKEPDTLVNYIVNEVYTGTDGESGLYLHDGSGTYGTLEAGDKSYRYTGANPNNYVCFGSDEETCPADNLYRIIGVFNGQVKLIKSDYAGESVLGTAPAGSGNPNTTYYKGSLSSIPYYYWSGSSSNQSNVWSSSTLNTSVLNGAYVNSLGSEWSDLIAITNWQVGGGTYDNLEFSNAQTAYNYEVGTNTVNTTYEAKIGLMYVSDYYYGANPTYWSYPGYTSSSFPDTDGNYGADYDYRAATNENWMHMGATEWPISRRSDISGLAFRVYDTGYVNNGNVYYSFAVRPSFYLQPWVLYSSGDGSESNLYRISAPENLIEFTINDTTYYAEEGMTWGEWISSNYNIDGFYISENSTICSDTSNGSGCLNKVSANQTIIKDRTYSGTHQGGGIS